MAVNAQQMKFNSTDQLKAELRKIGCDDTGVTIMGNKGTFFTIKIFHLAAKAANLLKQTMLAKGGDAAIARGTADLSVPFTDVLVMATAQQLHQAIRSLRLQPWGLKAVADEFEQIIRETPGEGFSGVTYHWPNRSLTVQPGHTLVMGILNVTPDSFSDGGKYNRIDAALYHAQEMVADGAAILDIGAESTRPYPGAQKISAEEELDRLMPVLERVLDFSPVPISVDTYKATVADAALKAGAHIINDIWGLQYEPEMAQVIARYGVPAVVMHNQDKAEYPPDLMGEVLDFLRHSIDIAEKAGIPRDHIIVDPGIGFAKTTQHNLLIMQQMERLRSLNCPVLLGTSRKRFIGDTLNLPVNERVEGTAATVALGIIKGAHIVRVHDVKEIVRVAKMIDAMLGADADE